MSVDLILDFLFKGLEMSAPIAFAALGGVFSEKSGVVNIALEGLMLTASFMIVFGSILTGSFWGGVLIAITAGVLLSLLHAVVTITYRVDQIVSGVAINILAVGLTRFLSDKIFNQETQSALNPHLLPNVFGINPFVFILIPV